MALALSFENSVIKLSMIGCHNGHCESKSNGCGEIKIFTEEFHPYVATPITRLFLHVQFGRKYKIDELIANFNTHFANEQHHQENGIDYWKKIILESLQDDPTWKICVDCDSEYKTEKLTFEKINYITPEKNLCIFHTKNQ